MQRDRVQQRLQPVVRAAHLRRQRLGLVVGQGQRLARRPQPVRLVVDDREPRTVQAQHEIDAPREKAPHLRPQRRILEPRGVRGHRIAGGQVLTERAGDRPQRQPPGRLVSARQGELELELVEPVRTGHVAQTNPVDDRAERRLDRGPQPLDDPIGIAQIERPARSRLGHPRPELGVEVRRRELGRLEYGMDERAEIDPHRRLTEQRFARAISDRKSPGPGTTTGEAISGSSLRTGRSGSLATTASCASAVMSV